MAGELYSEKVYGPTSSMMMADAADPEKIRHTIDLAFEHANLAPSKIMMELSDGTKVEWEKLS